MRVDRASRQLMAPPEAVYLALTNREAVQAWLPPAGARGVIHAFEPRPGGPFRMTLVFDTPGETGTRKSSENEDVVEGEFRELIPGRLVQQTFTFASDDPSFAGVMLMTWRLIPAEGGTEVEVTAEHVPQGISPADHRQGMESSLANLAKFVER